LGLGTDFLWVPNEEVLYVLMRPTSIVVLIVMSVLTVYMTLLLAHNLEAAVQPPSDVKKIMISKHAILPPVIMTVVLILGIYSNGAWDVWERFTTLEDECALSVLAIYDTYHIGRMITSTLYTDDTARSNTVNSIVGTLALVSLTYYNTMDNPYTTIITLIMSARLMFKLQSCMDGLAAFADDLVGDSIIIAILMYTGILPQLNYNPIVIGLYTFQGNTFHI
jgi:hypothetical protein